MYVPTSCFKAKAFLEDLKDLLWILNLGFLCMYFNHKKIFFVCKEMFK